METETATRTLRNYIGGGWVEAAADGTLEDRNPATGELTALVPLSGAADIDAAARAAAQGAAGMASGCATEARPRRDGSAHSAVGAPG